MAKYSGKDSDYLINQKYSMHFINHSKVNKFLFILVLFKEARKKLKNGDLDYLKEVDPTEYIYQIFITGTKKNT